MAGVEVRCSYGIVLLLALADVAAASDQVIVTAERRDQAADDAPVAISVLTKEDIYNINADHIAEALSRAPGVNLHRGSGAEHLTAIRSPVLVAGAGAGSFLFLENDVPLRSPAFSNINGLFDAHFELADRIEIMRGPSGAVYGANAIHGVVNVITPSPEEANQIFVDVFGDTEDRYKWKGAVAGAIGQHQVYIGGSATSEAGYRDDAGLDQQKITLRHVLDGDRIKIDTILSLDNLEQETAGFIFGRTDLFDRVRRRSNDFPEAFRDAKSIRAQSRVTVSLDETSELRIIPFARWNDMDFLQHFLPGQALEENSHWSIGAQSTYYRDAGPLSFIAGVDAEYTEGKLREYQAEPTVFSFTQGLHYDYAVKTVLASGFVQTSYEITPRLKATAAVRVDSAIYDYDNRTSDGRAEDGDGNLGRFLRLPDQQDKFLTASPKFSLRYSLPRKTDILLSYARGTRPPQTTDLYRVQTDPTGGQSGERAQSEFIDSIEVGVRTRPAEGISFAVTGFWMDKRNFFFRDADRFTIADGRTRHIGAEADISIVFHEALTLQSALTYAEHRYRFSRDTGSDSETITAGNLVDTAPRLIASTRLTWRPASRLHFEAEWRRVGDYFTNAANTRSYEGFDLLNLRANAQVTDNLSAYMILRNATDALYAERADFAFGSERFFPGETRTLGFGIRFSEAPRD